MPHDPFADAKPNMTSMIDIVFLLLIVFIVNMKFKTLDMKIEAFLPDEGLARQIQPREDKVKVVARLSRPSAGGATHLKLDGRVLGDVADPHVYRRLVELVGAARRRHLDVGGDPDRFEAEIDAAPRVAMGDVVRAIDAITAADVEKVTFRGTPPPDAR